MESLIARNTAFRATPSSAAVASLTTMICGRLMRLRAMASFWRCTVERRLPAMPTLKSRPTSRMAVRRPSSPITSVTSSEIRSPLSGLSVAILPNSALSRMLLALLKDPMSKNSTEPCRSSGRFSANAVRALRRRCSISSPRRSSRWREGMSLNGRSIKRFLSSSSRASIPLLPTSVRILWNSGRSSDSMKLNRSKNS